VSSSRTKPIGVAGVATGIVTVLAVLSQNHWSIGPNDFPALTAAIAAILNGWGNMISRDNLQTSEQVGLK
jgi:hypothetical protein